MKIDSITLYRVLEGDNILYSNWDASDVLQYAIDHIISGSIQIDCTIPLTTGGLLQGAVPGDVVDHIKRLKKKTKRKGKLIGGEEIVQG